MRRTDPSNKNRPEGNTNTLPPPTYTRIYPRCFNSTVNIYVQVSGSESAKAQTIACMAGLLTCSNPDAFPSEV